MVYIIDFDTKLFVSLLRASRQQMFAYHIEWGILLQIKDHIIFFNYTEVPISLKRFINLKKLFLLAFASRSASVFPRLPISETNPKKLRNYIELSQSLKRFKTRVNVM